MGGIFGSKTIVNEEKRIGDFQINSATYGLPVPVIIGTTRIAGNIIDWMDFTAIPHEQRQHAGKGGGTTVVNRTYTYTVAVLIGLCEGPIRGVGRIWKDKEVYVSLDALNYANTQQHMNSGPSKTDLLTIISGGMPFYGLTLFKGTHGQEPWSYTQSKHPEKALPYSGLAYMAGVVDLGSSASLPNFNFEVMGYLVDEADGLDANPADVIQFIVADPVNGVGFGIENIDMDSLNRLRTFCKAADVLISLPLTEQRPTYEIIRDICEATNTIHFWSQNKIKFVPRCDERLERDGVVFEPDTVPLYDLTPDDFLEMDDGRLVIFERGDNSEAYNHATVEFLNRDNQYKAELVEHKIQIDINRRGLRSAPTKKFHMLHTKQRAEYVACLIAMDSLYGRNKYRFRLGWAHCLLEPGDFVTLTEPTIGLDKKPVIIESIEEDEYGALEVIAKERPPGIYSPAKYQTCSSNRPSVDFNVDPGPVKTPIFYELPFKNGDEYYVGIAVCGQNPSWGGASVWMSVDGDTYQQVGEINGPSRYGKLVDAISATDTEMIVQLEDINTQLLSVSAASADANATLCCIGGEWVSYETATLLAAGKYRLSGLRRGVYGSMAAAHAANTDFVRYDTSGFTYPYRITDIGRTIYIKLPSRNIFGLNPQPLDDAVAYQYTIRGAGNMTRIEKRVKSIEANPDWTSFTFEDGPFNNPPATFWVLSQTVDAIAYFRNVTANGFEAKLVHRVTGEPMAGEFIYEAQGW